MARRLARLALLTCLLGAGLVAAGREPAARAQEGASASTCAASGVPPLFPYGPDDPTVFSTTFRGSAVPPQWWVPPSYVFNRYTVHDPAQVDVRGGALQLTNAPDTDGTRQDMGIAGESPVLETAGAMPNGLQGDSMLMAWCARITTSRYVDTDFELGQTDSRPWPPEIDLAEGAGDRLTVILHWTCDASIAGCPTTDGTYNGTVARTGRYRPWPPPGIKVGQHYFCDEITNAAGQQVTNNPSDGHYDYDCRSFVDLPLPPGVTVADWNLYGAAFDPRDDRFSVWVDGQRPVVIDAHVCGTHLLYDDNGVLPIGQIENGGSSEPCLQAKGNWQWDVQQTEWQGAGRLRA